MFVFVFWFVGPPAHHFKDAVSVTVLCVYVCVCVCVCVIVSFHSIVSSGSVHQ